MGDEKTNWYMFTEEEKKEKPMQNVMKVNSKAGDFILFDSRTFHCNTVPTIPSLRVCTYICMIPMSHVPEKNFKKRQEDVKNKRVSNHHPGDGYKIFAVQPRYLSDR